MLFFATLRLLYPANRLPFQRQIRHNPCNLPCRSETRAQRDETKMMPALIAEAQRMASEWRPASAMGAPPLSANANIERTPELPGVLSVVERRADDYISRHVVAYLRAFSAPPIGFILPCQPILVTHPPAGPDWLHEMKHDGYRIVARKEGERVTLWTRYGAVSPTGCRRSRRRSAACPRRAR